jgi:hypothetical protein
MPVGVPFAVLVTETENVTVVPSAALLGEPVMLVCVATGCGVTITVTGLDGDAR